MRHYLTPIAVLGASCVLCTSALANGFGDLNIGAVAEVRGGYVLFDQDAGNTDVMEDTGRFGGLLQADLMLQNIFPGSGLSLQGDLEGDFNFTGPGGGTGIFAPEHLMQAGGHLNWRDGEAGHMLGFFGGAAWVGIPNESSSNKTEETGYVLGGEAQANIDRFSIFAQGGIFWSSGNDSETMDDGWFISGGGMFFPMPDTMVRARFLYGMGDNNEPGSSSAKHDFDILGWDARLQHGVPADRLPLPVSLFVAYNGLHVDQEETGTPGGGTNDFITEHVILGGISLSLRTGTLQNTYQRRMAPAVPVDMSRAMGYTSDIVD